MKKEKQSLRSELGRVRALGAAGVAATHHWWLQRLTAIALIPLCFIVLNGFFANVVFGTYDSAVHWLRSPFSATFVILFLGVGLHHGASGLQVVIEDYVHCECTKLFSLIFVKFAAVTLAVLGILATVKVLFGV
ncbi:MAG TPA: succinate dehydrogenase, hydrophobic membrane anchor protein [Alphaproteobacteria bacterium]|nr:succinate dehydrogenase, hydrophobic membrane anchor protein [Alphaproteobacteria bacterium]